MTAQPKNDLLQEVEHALRIWYAVSRMNKRIFWVLGVLGVASSTLAAAEPVSGKWAPYLAATSSVCVSAIGFINPQRYATRFMSAHRLLKIAKLEYEFGQGTEATLIDALRRGEEIIGEQDSGQPGTASPIKADPVKRREETQGEQDSGQPGTASPIKP